VFTLNVLAVTKSVSQDPSSSAPRFNPQIRRVQQDVLRMGALVEHSSWLAYQALVERNLDAAGQIAAQDKAVDQLYRQIELDCINLMSGQASVSQDMRLLSAMMQLIRDLERIGDYAKDVGEIAVRLFPYPPHPHIARIGLMLDRCRAMLAMSLESLIHLDDQLGRGIKDKDDLVDDDYDSLYQLLVHPPQPPEHFEPIVLLVLTIRCLERMADHATNIGNRVVYIVTGKRG
jgi:phosphate transport system protein